jgi:hypothetical protein
MLILMLLIMINLLGIGYGYWGNEVSIKNTISTGCINTLITDLEVVQDNPYLQNTSDQLASALLNADKKGFHIRIDKAYPNVTTKIRFTIVNKGSIPVFCKYDGTSSDTIDVSLENPIGMLNPEEIKIGYILINIKNINHNEKINIPIGFKFIQYNSSIN